MWQNGWTGQGESLSSSLTARILIQQPILIFDWVQTIAHLFVDVFFIALIHGPSAYCRTSMYILPRGYPRKIYAVCLRKNVSYPCHVPYISSLPELKAFSLFLYRLSIIILFRGHLQLELCTICMSFCSLQMSLDLHTKVVCIGF